MEVPDDQANCLRRRTQHVRSLRIPGPRAKKVRRLWEKYSQKLIDETLGIGNVFHVFMDEHSYCTGSQEGSGCKAGSKGGQKEAGTRKGQGSTEAGTASKACRNREGDEAIGGRRSCGPY